MVSETLLTNDQIREKGLELLVSNLGPVGMVRFLQQTENGWGNYTNDRHNWLGEIDAKNIAEKIKTNKQGAQ